MLVYELMAYLANCDAGAKVFVSRGSETYSASLCDVEDMEDAVFLSGDGSEPEDEDVPL